MKAYCRSLMLIATPLLLSGCMLAQFQGYAEVTSEPNPQAKVLLQKIWDYGYIGGISAHCALDPAAIRAKAQPVMDQAATQYGIARPRMETIYGGAASKAQLLLSQGVSMDGCGDIPGLLAKIK